MQKQIPITLILTMFIIILAPKYSYAKELDSDPLIYYSSYFGGSAMESIKKILIDSEENIVIVGETYSDDFPIFNGFQSDYGGGTPNSEYIFGGDGFIAKLNSTGNLLWSSYFGGSELDQINTAVLDSEDNIIVCGNTESEDLPITKDALVNVKFLGGKDGFVAKIESNGTLLYASYLGGSGDDFFQSCAVDSNDNIFFTGKTDSNDFPISFDAKHSEIIGASDSFLLKLSNDLKSICYCSFLGTIDEDIGNDIEIDQNSTILIAGSTYISEYTQDIFISKFNLINLTEMQFSMTIPSIGRDDCFDIATDSLNNIIVAGRTFSRDFPVLNPFQSTSGEGEGVDAILTKINPTSLEYMFSTYFGGLGWDTFYDIVIQSNDEIFLCGIGDDNFPVKSPFQAESAGSGDCVIAQFSSEGELKFSSFYGGSGYEHCLSIAIEGSKLFLAGFTRSTDFNITSDAFQSTIMSDEDGFLTVFNMEKLNDYSPSSTIKVNSSNFFIWSISSIYICILYLSKKKFNKIPSIIP